MSNLSNDIDNLKKRYREIFMQVSHEFSEKMETLSAKEFQKYLNSDVSKEICEKHLKILNDKNDFSCSRCAACCKLACSEFSPEELKEKAQNGDNFAGQFTSIFVPYENIEDARRIFPEYFDLLSQKAPNEKVYFYHCPKVTAEGLCPEYENRPQICIDFPDNPIGFLPHTCGYKKWRESTEPLALKLHSLLEIVDFYKKKISSEEHMI